MRLIDADALIPQEIHTVIIIREDETKAIESVLFAEQVDNAPTIDAAPVKHGEWIKNEDRNGWHCSECKVDNYYAYSWSSEKGTYEFQDNYCPNCGASMDGGKNDDAD